MAHFPIVMLELLKGTDAMIGIVVLSMVVVLFAMIIDLISGLMKAKQRHEVRSSYGLKRTLNKFIMYEGGMLIAAGVDLVLLNDEVLIGDNQSIEYGVSVQVSGLYRIGFDYIAQNDSKNPLELALKIDGNTPFEELSKLSTFLNKYYIALGDALKD